MSVNCFAQNSSADHKTNINIPSVALLALQSDGNTTLNLSATAPNIAGNHIEIKRNTNSNIWINYSSVIRPGQKRTITATVVGEIPKGVQLKLQTSECMGKGEGQLGVPVQSAPLSNQPTEVISDIGSCYTGKGAKNGHLLSYQLELDDQTDLYSQLSANSASVSIVYTLTDNN